MSKSGQRRRDGIRLVLDTDDPSQRWQYRCPRGHTQWEPTNFHWWCAECARAHDDVDPDFRKLVDEKTGDQYFREEVRIEGYRRKTH